MKFNPCLTIAETLSNPSLLQDLDNIKACRRDLGKSFDLSQLLQARLSPIQSEIHLYILTVCIQVGVVSLFACLFVCLFA